MHLLVISDKSRPMKAYVIHNKPSLASSQGNFMK